MVAAAAVRYSASSVGDGGPALSRDGLDDAAAGSTTVCADPLDETTEDDDPPEEDEATDAIPPEEDEATDTAGPPGTASFFLVLRCATDAAVAPSPPPPLDARVDTRDAAPCKLDLARDFGSSTVVDDEDDCIATMDDAGDGDDETRYTNEESMVRRRDDEVGANVRMSRREQ